MLGQLKQISRFGTSLNYPAWQNRNIIVANHISMFCFLAISVLTTVHALSHSENEVVYAGIMATTCFLLVPLLLRLGKIDLGRTFLTIILIAGTVTFTIVRKLFLSQEIFIGTYYNSRIALLVFSMTPLATFHFSEKKLTALNILIGLTALLLYDPIHNFFGVGYYQMGFADPDYYYNNFIYLIIFVVLIGIVGSFKREMDTYGKRNEELIKELHTQNNLVGEQKEELAMQSEVLKELLREKDIDLSMVTQQLINFNHELLQYSYTISHNLRGPVARILGLLDVLKNYSTEQERENIMQMLHTSTLSLDGIIQDLNKIVEIRSNSF